MSAAEIDSAEVATCGNPLWLLLGILTLAIFGIGLLFFVFKYRFLVVYSSSNVVAVAIKGDPVPCRDFMYNVVKLTNH
ncbi:MAG: hypothetical protein ACR2NP_13550 [Pirellulaceae bacterium]